jgi:hypothetical protein
MHSETCLSQTSLGPAFTFRIDRFSPSSLAKGYNPLLSSPLERGGADRNPWLGARPSRGIFQASLAISYLYTVVLENVVTKVAILYFEMLRKDTTLFQDP